MNTSVEIYIGETVALQNKIYLSSGPLSATSNIRFGKYLICKSMCQFLRYFSNMKELKKPFNTQLKWNTKKDNLSTYSSHHNR